MAPESDPFWVITAELTLRGRLRDARQDDQISHPRHPRVRPQIKEDAHGREVAPNQFETLEAVDPAHEGDDVCGAHTPAEASGNPDRQVIPGPRA
jgi:hypothetical protein